MRISDWSSDVCSSDLEGPAGLVVVIMGRFVHRQDRREAGVERLEQPAPFVARFREELRPDLLLEGRQAGRVRRIAEFVRIARSEERRVGTEWVSTCRHRWWLYH